MQNALAKAESPMQILKRIYRETQLAISAQATNVFQIVKAKVLRSKPKCKDCIPQLFNLASKHCGNNGEILHSFAAFVCAVGACSPEIKPDMLSLLIDDFKGKANQAPEFRLAAFSMHCIYKNLTSDACKRLRSNAAEVMIASDLMHKVRATINQAPSDEHASHNVVHGRMSVHMVCNVLGLPLPEGSGLKERKNLESIALDACASMGLTCQDLESYEKAWQDELAEENKDATQEATATTENPHLKC